MLEGFVPWPPEVADRYRAAGVWRGQSLLSLLQAPALADSSAPALIANDQHWTRGELWHQVARRATGFTRIGLNPGDRVVVQLPNSGDFVISFLALLWCGVIPVLALPGHRLAELRHIAATCPVRFRCCSRRCRFCRTWRRHCCASRFDRHADS